MAVAKNVTKGEGIVRVILGVILIPLGFFLTGFWTPLSIVVGGFLVVTAFLGY